MNRGFGKVYIRFESLKDAEAAKKAIFKRRFNNRFVETFYYSEEKFNTNVFEWP